jgi:hypothetical protein
VNILDENFPESQRQLLRGWRIRVRQIGFDVGRAGMKDEEIPALLLGLSRPTLFTLDQGFYRRDPCHAGYCIVCLEVGDAEAATFVRKVLRQPTFNTVAKRMGRIARVTHNGLAVRRTKSLGELLLAWQE